MKKFRFRRVLTVLAITAASAGAVTTASFDIASASGRCNIPYYSGHRAIMNCTGTGVAGLTVRCSSFGFWFAPWPPNVTLSTAKYINGSGQVVIDCGWGKWPAETKGFTNPV